MQTPEELVAAFRRTGLKVTPQRQLLFRLMHNNTGHPSAEALFDLASEQMPGISLRTVYQTLSDLAAMGELQQIDLGVGPSRFDPNTGEHHHFICDLCGQIADVQLAGVATIASSANQSVGLRVRSTEVIFRGVCNECSDTIAISSTK